MIVSYVCKCGALLSERKRIRSENSLKIEIVEDILDRNPKKREPPVMEVFICRECKLIWEPPNGLRTYSIAHDIRELELIKEIE